MSRKDYELIAQAFKDELDDELVTAEEIGALKSLANRLAFCLSEDNDRFNAVRFITACGF